MVNTTAAIGKRYRLPVNIALAGVYNKWNKYAQNCHIQLPLIVDIAHMLVLENTINLLF